MDRRLIDYLPPVLREVEEFQTVNGANEPEIALAWDVLAMVMANQFLEEADERGVVVWERELKILPKDTDTLELRKARIKAMWNRETPYTVPWLRNWLTGIFGADRHAEKVEDYTLTIQLRQDRSAEMNRKTGEVLEMLQAVIPENIWMELENIFPTLHLQLPITPRLSVSALPPPRRGPLSVNLRAAPMLGARISTITLPMAAEKGV